MSDLKQARETLGMARKDLKALKGMMDTDVFAEEIFGFHAQQAVEKSLNENPLRMQPCLAAATSFS